MAGNLYYEDEVLKEQVHIFMLKRLIQYASVYRRTYIKTLVLLMLTSLFSLLPAALNKVIIDRVLPQNGVVAEHVGSLAVCLLSLWTAISIGYVVSDYFCNNITNRLGNDVVCDLRKSLFEHLMKLGFDYYDSRPTGKILVRITNYTDEIADFFIHDMTRIIVNVCMMLFSILAVFVIEPRLALVVLVVSLPLALAIWKVSCEMENRVNNDRNKYSNRTAFISEDITGLEVIKAFNREELNAQIHEELNEKYREAFMRTTRMRELLFPMTHGMVRIICTVVIYGTALLIVHDHGGQMSLGALVTVSTYMGTFASCINVLCQRLQNIATTTANIRRIFDVLDTEPAVKDKADAFEMPEIVGNVTFTHVTFGYPSNPNQNVLEDVSFAVEAGQMVALIGPTGAGKTTIISLLDRFYDIDAGSVRIDGIDIRNVTLESLRRQIGVMMQDTFLFTDTIMENIRFARPDATDEECIAAAKKVYADAFIQRLPEGYQTKISSVDTQLSGGERQLLSFARLILANPRIVILDEATSNIDTETEAQIQKSLKEVLRQRTSFVIAHRLSTIRDADRIFCVDRQRVTEQTSIA